MKEVWEKQLRASWPGGRAEAHRRTPLGSTSSSRYSRWNVGVYAAGGRRAATRRLPRLVPRGSHRDPGACAIPGSSSPSHSGRLPGESLATLRDLIPVIRRLNGVSLHLALAVLRFLQRAGPPLLRTADGSRRGPLRRRIGDSSAFSGGADVRELTFATADSPRGCGPGAP